MLHNLAVQSIDAVKTESLWEEKSAEYTMFTCPVNFCEHSPVVTLHRLAVVSYDAVNTDVPSEAKLQQCYTI